MPLPYQINAPVVIMYEIPVISERATYKIPMYFANRQVYYLVDGVVTPYQLWDNQRHVEFRIKYIFINSGRTIPYSTN
jgi:hypothetical protein